MLTQAVIHGVCRASVLTGTPCARLTDTATVSVFTSLS